MTGENTRHDSMPEKMPFLELSMPDFGNESDDGQMILYSIKTVGATFAKANTTP
jgi:hypothetical protein